MSLSSSVDLRQFAAANNEFAVGLYQALRSQDGNLFFSPYSIRTALAMAHAGARGNTALQMAQVLGLPEAGPRVHGAFRAFEETLESRRSEDGIEVDAANALWAQSGLPLVKEFVDALASGYRSAVLEADFAGSPRKACKAINQWVADKTRKRIRDLADQESMKMTLLVLANAIYFNGKWVSPFFERMTHRDNFVTESEGSGDKKAIPVPMMRQEHTFGYAEDDDLQALEMPYVGGKLSMVLFLPKAWNGWRAFEGKISAGVVAQRLHQLRQGEVRAFIPKFRFTTSYDLAPTLEAMGMSDAFKDALADFSAMTPMKPFWISKVIHKAGVGVDEAGTEAYAATMMEMTLSAPAYSPPIFRADHPFIFMIRDIPTGAILFMGRVMNPAD